MSGRNTGRPHFPLGQACFLVSKRTLFWERREVVVVWMLHIGRPDIGVVGNDPVDNLSVEFVNVGDWLTNGDVPLDSGAQFRAMTEHRSTPARARSIGHQLRKAGLQSVWAPACQVHVPAGHAGCGVFRLHGAPLRAPSPVAPEFGEFSRLGRAMRVCFSHWCWLRGSLVCCLRYQGVEEDPEKLSLTDRLLNTVLAEAQVVCVGQLVLIVGDFHADPGIVPCLAKGMSAGQFVD